MAARISMSEVGNMGDMFKIFTGESSDAKEIKRHMHMSYKKYTSLKEQIAKYVTLLEIMSNNIQDPVVNDYIKLFHETYLTLFSYTFSAGCQQYVVSELFDKLPDDEVISFNQSFNLAKKSKLISDVLYCCTELIKYSALMEDEKIFNQKLTIFRDIPFNISDLYKAGQEAEKRLWFSITLKLFKITKQIYTILCMPEFDTKIFSSSVLDSIMEVESKIPGCKEAFAVIRGSIDTLDSSFSKYYESYMSTGNNFTLVDEYINDLKSQHKNNPKLISQFRTISLFYQKSIKQKRSIGAMKESTEDKAIQDLSNSIDEQMKLIAGQYQE